MPSHRLSRTTTLGVGVPAYFRFHDEARDYQDFVDLYSRYLLGPAEINPYADADEQMRLRRLNWRVWGQAEPKRFGKRAVTWGDPTHPAGSPLGLWDVKRLDTTGIPEEVAAAGGPTLDAYLAGLPKEEVAERTLSDLWARNVITDTGATQMLKSTWNNAVPASVYNYLVIAFGNRSYAVLTTALTAGQTAVTSLACSGGIQVVAMPNSSPITVSYGTANAETFTTGASAGALGATSIAVASQTSVNAHSVNDYIVTQPSTSDNPSSVSNSANSGALAAGAFTFSGTGAGNRQVQIQYTFSTSTTAGAYTESYTSNAATIAAGTTGSHLIFPPQTINSTTSLQLTVTEKC